MSQNNYITSFSYKTKDEDDNEVYIYEVGTCPMESVALLLDESFTSKAIVSLNELFCPYIAVINDEASDLMAKADFTRRDISVCSGDARPEIIGSDFQSGINHGTCPTFGEEIAESNDDIFDKKDVEDIRSIAFKAPMMVAGFGYTTEGMPFPSKFDELTKDDDSYNPTDEEKQYDKHVFSGKARDRTDLWKAGPLDIRWDDYRNMYVAAPENFIGYAMCNIPASSGRYAERKFTSGEIELSIGRYEDYHTPSGSEGSTTIIAHKLLIINRSVSMDIPSGALVIATRLNNGEYMPIFADCAPDLEE